MERADPQETDDRVDEYLDRVRSLPGDSVAGAFAPPTPHERADPDDAFAETFIADAPLDGPLAELDLAVKENLAVGGVTTTCGTDCFEWTPDIDAIAVERLRTAGGTIVGTTDMDPFAFGTTGEQSARGRTENPVVEGRVPGGSSSGSAAAVAGGSVDAALGTDTAGSVRIPAAFCGIVGYKPTFGMVPAEGVVPLSPSNDHVGVLARTVETAARVLEAIAGQAATRPDSLPAPSRLSFADDLGRDLDDLCLGVPTEFMKAATPAVEAAVEAAVTKCGIGLDAEVSSVTFPEAGAAVDANDAGTVMEFAALLERGSLLGTGARADLRAAIRRANERRDALPDRVRELVGTGRRLRSRAPDAYGRTWDARRRTIRRQQALFAEVDVLAMPTTPITAPEFGAVPGDDGPSVLDTVANTAPFNATGAPAVSVPCGEIDGRPVGLQLVGPPGADGFLLQIAESVERALAQPSQSTNTA
ncbi:MULTISPECIES: amidase [Halolamina]|uniref:Aspartyl-tRNA(Asn)/glutamyl-tRNA(Gln) amidotransferase subunit A n=1 Tax=Halolamina pelagica TaxID=699431 RepID=A0A1I5QBN6_9EURY|nr:MULTISPECIES: amidase [Halolamina]NHX35192.1 amidase [Halolamina sp. R1-12]SFP43718.1 aspartyl-tRNA(Asn)/glutamyl-tRNA(Gln) amidotransferase subunit A [Halolamina pelagica]